jgi:hypothetical protein
MNKKIVVLAISAIIFSASACSAADVILGWTAPDDPRVTGYNVYVSPTLADLHDHLAASVVAPTTQATITGLAEGQGYFFGATSTSADAESGMSDILHYTVAPTAQVIEIPARPTAITIQFGE